MTSKDSGFAALYEKAKKVGLRADCNTNTNTHVEETGHQSNLGPGSDCLQLCEVQIEGLSPAAYGG
jgi:hypothetical protein